MDILPTLNGKSFLDCTEEDLQELIDNPDYRENEFIDYKETLAFLLIKKENPERQNKIVEFRNDVCAFANADGGYLIYGITDEKGMAKEIIGIDIPNNNTDKFELERKNNLASIMPKIPSLQFGYIPLRNGKFVVVIQIRKDGFAPYIHLENDTNYKAYKRVGNGKSPIGYVELKKMFNQSLSLENEVHEFRKKRINFHREQEDEPNKRNLKFILFHIIPDSFSDSSTRRNMFLLHKQNPSLDFCSIFRKLCGSCLVYPNVDGMRFAGRGIESWGLIYNNGIAECYCASSDYWMCNQTNQKVSFAYKAFWDDVQPVVWNYIETMKEMLETKRLFLCISVLGSKDVISRINQYGQATGVIDRNTILCNPIIIEDMTDKEDVKTALKWLKMEYFLSLGINDGKEFNQLMAEVSNNDYQ